MRIGPSVGFATGLTPAAAERQLAALGYEGPQTALTHLSALVNLNGRRGRVQSVLLPRLLDWLSDTPDPDSGLLAYRRISEVMADQRWYLSTLRDESAVAKRLMHVLGTSPYVPELLMRAPEVIQAYADGPTGPKLLDTDPASVAKALVAAAGTAGPYDLVAQQLVGVEARLGEELLDLAHRLQPGALPAAEAEQAGRLDRPVLHAHERRRGRRVPLNQPRVVVPQRLGQCLQPRGR